MLSAEVGAKLAVGSKPLQLCKEYKVQWVAGQLGSKTVAQHTGERNSAAKYRQTGGLIFSAAKKGPHHQK
jgi:hypothetical protein